MGAENNSKKILIVDDESNTREILRYIFKGGGFIIEDARNGKEALQKVAQDKPDIIILDVAMPEMDGFQACKQLRENPDTKDIPIIFLSAQRDIVEFIQDMPGATIEYIEKPCDIVYLIKRVNNLLPKQKTP